MIQRIQSVYLLMAGLVLAFSFCTPQINFSGADGVVATMYVVGIESISSSLGPVGANISTPWGVTCLMGVACLMSLGSIFLFKNRSRQIKVVNWLLVVVLFIYIAELVYAFAFNAHHETSMRGAWGIVLPFAAYVFVWLARRGIRKDEALVRAADRIR